jgi:hypothetical protein
MGRTISNLVVLAIIVGGAYYLWNWKSASTGSSEAMAYAEESCVSEIRGRFDTTTVRSNSVKKNANGYVVKGSMTLARGNVAKVTCLTNEHGRVRDVSVDE